MKQKQILQVAIFGISLVVVIAFAFWLNQYTQEHDIIQEWFEDFGLLGILLVSFISGFNVVVPIPIASFIPTLVAVGHTAWVVIGIITLGMTLGDGVGFLIGKKSGELAEGSRAKIYDRLKRIQEKYYRGPLWILFVYASIAPAPNELLVIPMGFLGYKAKHMLPILFVGNGIFNSIVGLGFIELFSLFG